MCGHQRNLGENRSVNLAPFRPFASYCTASYQAKSGFAIIPWNNPKKLEKPYITKGQDLAIFIRLILSGNKVLMVDPENRFTKNPRVSPQKSWFQVLPVRDLFGCFILSKWPFQGWNSWPLFGESKGHFGTSSPSICGKTMYFAPI